MSSYPQIWVARFWIGVGVAREEALRARRERRVLVVFILESGKVEYLESW